MSAVFLKEKKKKAIRSDLMHTVYEFQSRNSGKQKGKRKEKNTIANVFQQISLFMHPM